MERQRKKIYYGLMWKKGMQQLPFFLMVILFTAILLAALFFGYRSASEEKQILKPVSVAIVIPDDDENTGMAAHVIESMESVQSICEFLYMDEKEADEKLTDGRIEAAIFFDEDMYHTITDGEKALVTVKTRDGSDFRSALFRDLIESGISYLNTGDAAMFAIADTASVYPLSKKLGKVQYNFTMDLAKTVLKRGNLWDSEVVSSYGQVNMTQYYVVSAILVLLLLFGIGFAPLYSSEARRTDLALKRVGIGPFTSGAARILPEITSLFALYAILYLAAVLLIDDIRFSALFLIAGIPVCFGISAFIHVVYSLSDTGAASFLYLAIGLIMFFLAGGLFPTAFLPGILKQISRILPLGFWIRSLCGAQKGEAFLLPLLVCVGYGIILFIIGEGGKRRYA